MAKEIRDQLADIMAGLMVDNELHGTRNEKLKQAIDIIKADYGSLDVAMALVNASTDSREEAMLAYIADMYDLPAQEVTKTARGFNR